MEEEDMDFDTALRYSEAVVISGEDLTKMSIEDQSLIESQKGAKL